MRIALFGATGRVGQAFLKEAGANKQYDIYALAREQKNVPHLPPERISTGNARNRDDVQHVITGSDMVISCLGTDGDDTLSVSMKHVIDIMEEENMKRLITVGTAGILKSRQHPQKFRFETNESKRKLTRAAEEHAKVFTMLEASGLDWTTICPTYLPDGEATGVYRFEKDFLPEGGSKITVGDTAHFLYQQLEARDFIRDRVGLAY
ncbi:SDR family oxidoreductase [Bacillus atrophaeus]|uniref:NAD(P)-dependent oxidoreductase n=1 Tax=Bacillus atrophaeus TaxID=1452 RepID=UPI002E1E8F9F|nr:SDR family oxidoreductase [Bacillus atrophaeus]MED4818647.1 SDR family oxidoreductase [Bacillus atrophaeus]